MKFQNLARAAAGAALGLTLAFGTVAPALAATITINKAADGETYTAYKLFDVTKSANGGHAYSLDADSSLVSLLQVNELDDILSLTLSADGSVYNVSGLETEDDAKALAEYLSKNVDQLTSSGSDVASDGVASIEDLDEGYYFVDTTLGSLCILSTTGSTEQIEEKNSAPSIEKTVYEDSTTSYVESATLDVVDTAKYQLKVTVGKGNNGNYVIADQLPDGIVPDTDSVTIDGWTIEADYDVAYVNSTNTMMITLHANKLGTLDAGSEVIISYDADVDLNLKTMDPHVNTVTLTYQNQRSTDQATVKTYQIKGDAEGSIFTKVDGKDDAALAGVKFVLQNSVTKKYATFDSNHYLTGWVNSIDEATELETDHDGHIYAYGLDADTYILTETETLPGYNLLSDTITVVIAEDGKVTYKLTNSGDDAKDEIKVENNTGSELPSTGGMGTTALYIVGGALVVGAGITLVVRRRMSAEA